MQISAILDLFPCRLSNENDAVEWRKTTSTEAVTGSVAQITRMIYRPRLYSKASAVVVVSSFDCIPGDLRFRVCLLS